ncbi:hypothetical protein [Streptomyces sp. NPDC097619]|uniref:hypothetical protein n=1 Tax=Streptomyces sp. NPDC097619 TaxID=3157228 RepID=UPI00331753A9
MDILSIDVSDHHAPGAALHFAETEHGVAVWGHDLFDVKEGHGDRTMCQTGTWHTAEAVRLHTFLSGIADRRPGLVVPEPRRAQFLKLKVGAQGWDNDPFFSRHDVRLTIEGRPARPQDDGPEMIWEHVRSDRPARGVMLQGGFWAHRLPDSVLGGAHIGDLPKTLQWLERLLVKRGLLPRQEAGPAA